MKGITDSNILNPSFEFYLWMLAISILVIAYYNLILGGLGTIILIYLIYHYLRSKNEKKYELKRYIEELSDNVDTATKNVILNLPFPLVILNEDGTINWYNSLFFRIFEGEYLLDKNLDEFISNFKLDAIQSDEKRNFKNLEINGEYYDLYCESFKTADTDLERIIIVYLIDKTEYIQLANNYIEEKSVVAILQIDNLDEVLSDVEDSLKPGIIADLDRIISSWSAINNASIQKYSNGEYILHFNNKQLKSMEEKRFEILDTAREIDSGAGMPITLSIGVGVGGASHTELQSYAKSAMDIALGRGGDQAVVKNKDKLSFYGGKSRAIEKRTKVKARVISHALKHLIVQANDVFIMGHEIQDLDCLGSALGIYRCCNNLSKPTHIILNNVNAGIKNLWDELKDDDSYSDVFVRGYEALAMANKNSLLIVVDVHRPSFTEEPELVKKIEKKVIIDHHRRGTEFIENAVLTYIEPYASSTSELVTEILQYMFDKPKIRQIEAEALLAGIFIDTKNFSFQTGARTFEAASFLRRAGADTTLTRQLFQNDMETYIDKAEVIKNAWAFKDNIAISIIPESIKNPALIAAQAADELLNIRGINASFVLSKVEEHIFISARSLGDINVQIVLERLGGGGHLTVAGAQLSDISMDEAVALVEEAISEYIKEGER